MESNHIQQHGHEKCYSTKLRIHKFTYTLEHKHLSHKNNMHTVKERFGYSKVNEIKTDAHTF